jgi:hypothetical protein
MITTDHRGSLVSVTVLGEFTLADFIEFEELILAKVRYEGPVDLLFDLREMAGFTVDMAWEEIKFSREHGGDFRRIAVVSDSQWVAWSAWLEQIFVSADLRVFSDANEALAWLGEATAEGAGA